MDLNQGSEMLVRVTEAFQEEYPDAHLGVLAMAGAKNPARHEGLERLKRQAEAKLRRRYSGFERSDLAALPHMRAYQGYYRRFRKTYHVLLQVRSIALEGKSIPSVAALVEAMFIAEIKNGLLTAGHDLDAVVPPLVLDVAVAGERYVTLNGEQQLLKPTDMVMRDRLGVVCSVIYGLDRRTAIGPATCRAMFVVYAPRGIPVSAVHEHLSDIETNVHVISPEATVIERRIHGVTDQG